MRFPGRRLRALFSALRGFAPIAIALRMWQRQSAENLGLLAAGIAFYGLLSLFPGITAAVALAGTFLRPEMLVENSAEIAAMLPEAAETIVMGQLRAVAEADNSRLNFAALLGFLIALYSASRMVSNFISGLNVIFEISERRGFFHLRFLTVFLTLAMILGSIVAVVVVAAIPVIAAVFAHLGLIDDAVLLMRWPALFLFGVLGIAMLYRLGPNRADARGWWITPGAVVACALWVAGSYGFSSYVQSFGSYNETFGALGGVIILLTWLWLSAFIVLLGALMDAEIQRYQTNGSSSTPTT